MKKKITAHDVKQALLDERFRATLPPDLSTEVAKFLKNPGCACNHSIYLTVIQKAKKQLTDYFPSKEEPDEIEAEKEINKLSKNQWHVINCNIHELVHELRKLGPGRKQLDVARFEDQVTVVVNHLEGLY